MVAWLEAQGWKIGAGVATLVALILGWQLIVADARNDQLARAVDTLQQSIDAPVTGWAARLAQAQTNVATLQTSLDGQTAAVNAAAAESARRQTEAEAAVQAAQAAIAAARRRADDILALKLTGADTCTRLLEVDAAFLEMLK